MRLRPTLKLEIIVFVLDANNVGLTLVQSHFELVDPQFELVDFTPNSSHAILHLYQITTLVDDIRNTIYVTGSYTSFNWLLRLPKRRALCLRSLDASLTREPYFGRVVGFMLLLPRFLRPVTSCKR